MVCGALRSGCGAVKGAQVCGALTSGCGLVSLHDRCMTEWIVVMLQPDHMIGVWCQIMQMIVDCCEPWQPPSA